MFSSPLILHVNYVEQGQTIAEMCELATRWGYAGIEFRRRRSPDEGVEAYLDEIARCAERSRLQHVLFGGPGPDLMNPDAGARGREVDQMIVFYRQAARRFPLTVCNCMSGELLAAGIAREQWPAHGSAAARDEHWQWAADGLRKIGEVAAELKLRLALETHMHYLHDLPEATMKLVGLVNHPAVGINFDYGNMIHFPSAPTLEAAYETVRAQTCLLHLKNVVQVAGYGQSGYFRCPLSDGAINQRQLIRLLIRDAYAGPLVVEAPRPGDREWFAQQDIAYLRSVIEDLTTRELRA